MKAWRNCRMGDVVDLQQGICINKKTNHLIEKKGLPLLRITDLKNNTQCQYIDENKIAKKFITDRSDLIYTRTGQVGLVFKNKQGILHNNCFRIIPNIKIQKNYLYYYLKQKTIREFAISIASGAAQPDLGHNTFKCIPFHYPSEKCQKKIAAILSAYDDLIENNNRRIAILENMAEEIYKEWFVRMRFPGYEAVKFEKGVPANWEIVKIGDILELVYGKALKQEDRMPGEFPVYGSSGKVGEHKKAIAKGPGIIVGRKGNVGSIYWSDYDFYPIDTVYYVQSSLSKYYLYFLLKTIPFINSDAAVPGLNRKQAYSNKFFLPQKKLIESYTTPTLVCYGTNYASVFMISNFSTINVLNSSIYSSV